ncbi:hypothetical protein V6Z12_D05G080200 [Gossypium hirsutum]
MGIKRGRLVCLLACIIPKLLSVLLTNELEFDSPNPMASSFEDNQLDIFSSSFAPRGISAPGNGNDASGYLVSL